MRGQRGKQKSYVDFNDADKEFVRGSVAGRGAVLCPEVAGCGTSSGRVSSPGRVPPSSSLTLQGTALRSSDVRGCSGLVNSDGMRRPSGSACSKGSSAVVMHGHRMRSDFDLDSVFVPHSRSFSLCFSTVSEVSHSSQSVNSCGEHGSALGHKNSCNLHAAEFKREQRR